MQRPIDHIVHCVGDLAAARRFHQRLGFTLTPQAQHPFGTANSLVQLQGGFLDFLEKRRGVSMLVFASEDARRDHADFLAKGLDTYAPFDFERRARLPDGSEVTVGFSLAFVTHPAMPEAAFFVCQQHAPQYFWKTEYQRHANTAVAIAEIVMAAPEPAALAPFFAKLQGEESLGQDAEGLVVSTGRGRIRVLGVAAARARFPEVERPATPRFIGYRLELRDLAAAAAILEAEKVPYRELGGVLQVAASENFGAALEFAPAR